MREGMNRLRSPAFLLSSLCLLACAGRVQGGGGGGDGGSGETLPIEVCPDPAQVDPGGACTTHDLTCPSNLLTGCPNTHYGEQSVDCTCISGVWECVGTGGCPGPPLQPCPDPANVLQGVGCYVDPQVACPSTLGIPTCDGSDAGVVSCNCIGNSWQCPVFGAPLCLGEAGVGEAGVQGIDAGVPDAAFTD
jgi:hypothetical protein